MVNLLGDDTEDVGVAAAKALLAVGSPGRAAIVAAATAPRKRVRMRAMDALPLSPSLDASAVAALDVGLGDASWEVRMRAADVFLTFPGAATDASKKLLKSALSDGDAVVRSHAQAALDRIAAIAGAPARPGAP